MIQTYDVGHEVHSDDKVSNEKKWASIVSIVGLHHDVGIAVRSEFSIRRN